jgi:crossover junction endodeoxyribonuclease RuvC
MANKPIRILAWDLSLSSPGAAVIEIKSGKPRVIACTHVKTDAKLPMATRGKLIEAWAKLFIADHIRKGFAHVVREKYSGSFGHHPMYTGHVAADRAMSDFGIEDTDKPIAQQSVKKQVVGKGKAEKHEVEEAVRRLTGYTGEFATSDESDAVAIALACAKMNGLLKEAE